MSFAAELADRYPGALSTDEYARAATAALRPFGFVPGNFLPMIGVCRDELMFTVEHRLHQEWGPAFDLTSLAGMVLLGRSGIGAATHHAPDDSGRQRFVIVLLPHIGLDGDGHLGQVWREGQPAASQACGALARIQAELAAGRLELGVDRHDLELSTLRLDLLSRLPYGTVPDLVQLTELTRQIAVAEIELLTTDLVSDVDRDVAVLSGTVIHGPRGDWIAPAGCWVSLSGGAPTPFQVTGRPDGVD